MISRLVKGRTSQGPYTLFRFAGLNDRQWPYEQETRKGSTLIQRLVYGYNDVGDVVSIDDQVNDADDVTATYDGLHRLATASGLWGTYGYTYDTLNNIRRRTGPNSLTYDYDGSNRLTGISGSQTRMYSYNAQGEITSDGDKTLTLSCKGQLLSVDGEAIYTYDGNGRRIKKKDNITGAIEYALYDASGSLVFTRRLTPRL